MKTSALLVPFFLGEKRYALSLSSVEKVVRAVEITALPKAPDIVLGVINAGGRIIPVVDARKRFGLPGHEPGLKDHLIIAETPKRAVALVADRVDAVIEINDADITQAENILPGDAQVEGVAKLADGLLLIHDLAGFLSLDEEAALDEALRENGKPR